VWPNSWLIGYSRFSQIIARPPSGPPSPTRVNDSGGGHGSPRAAGVETRVAVGLGVFVGVLVGVGVVVVEAVGVPVASGPSVGAGVEVAAGSSDGSSVGTGVAVGSTGGTVGVAVGGGGFTTTVKAAEAVLPAASTAVQVTLVALTGKVLPEGCRRSCRSGRRRCRRPGRRS
jgi:hypothetical protein